MKAKKGAGGETYKPDAFALVLYRIQVSIRQVVTCGDRSLLTQFIGKMSVLWTEDFAVNLPTKLFEVNC
ncbi:MAG: hypothetical protein WBL95_24625 [Microcoleus sp.]